MVINISISSAVTQTRVAWKRNNLDCWLSTICQALTYLFHLYYLIKSLSWPLCEGRPSPGYKWRLAVKIWSPRRQGHARIRSWLLYLEDMLIFGMGIRMESFLLMEGSALTCLLMNQNQRKDAHEGSLVPLSVLVFFNRIVFIFGCWVFVAARAFSGWGAWASVSEHRLLGQRASGAAAPGLSRCIYQPTAQWWWLTGLVTPQHVGSS